MSVRVFPLEKVSKTEFVRNSRYYFLHFTSKITRIDKFKGTAQKHVVIISRANPYSFLTQDCDCQLSIPLTILPFA
jgi:hypothetical protein